MNIFKWFINLFKSNRTIMKLAVMSLAGEYFEKNKKSKVAFNKVYTAISGVVSGGSVITGDLSTFVKKHVKLENLSAPEQALFFVLMDEITPAISEYMTKEKIVTTSQQTATYMQVLGWINDMTLIG
jgi:hypothetical protein